MPARFPGTEESESEREDLTSRSDLKRANRVVEEALERLTSDLSRLNDKKLSALELPESVHEALLEYRAIESPRAKTRQLRLVRAELRGADWSSIQKRLLLLLAHGTLPASTAATAEGNAEAAWVTRLLGEGNPGLEAFVAEHPRADRTHLRQLVRAAERASGDRRNKAERRLREAVRGFLRLTAVALAALAFAACDAEQELTSDCLEHDACPPCSRDAECIIVSNECLESAACTHAGREPPLAVNQLGCSTELEYDEPPPERCGCVRGVCQAR